VGDCGSTDGSPEIAGKLGARVVGVDGLGYGNAYLSAIQASSGRFIVMVDSDGTYEVNDLPKFVRALESGYDYVVGNRFKGGIKPNAMPFLHQAIGNPLLSLMVKLMSGSKANDSYCGLRAFTRDAFERMNPRAKGMEFALELCIRAARLGLKETEIPTPYYPRRAPSKLRTIRDGWRSLRFVLLFGR